MKNWFYYLLFIFITISCKDNSVRLNGTTQDAFEVSIKKASKGLEDEDKLSEAVRLIYNHDAPDLEEEVRWAKIRSMLNRKTADEVFDIAESVATSKGIPWTRKTPSGSVNLLKGKSTHEEYNPNNENVVDYSAVKNGTEVKITAKNYDADGDGIQDGISLSPKIIDDDGTELLFTNIPLVAKVQILSLGSISYNAKTIYSNSNQDIQIPYSKLAAVANDMVDINFSIEMPQKGFKTQLKSVAIAYNDWKANASNTTTDTPTGNEAKETVQKFFNSIANGNYKSAHDLTDNPKWSDFEKFKSPTLGYGSVKKVDIYSNEISEIKINKATVVTSYKAFDPTNGNAVIKQSFTLEKRNDIWIITDSKLISRVNE